MALQINLKLKRWNTASRVICFPKFVHMKMRTKFYFLHDDSLFLEGKFTDYEVNALVNTYMLLLSEAERLDLDVADALIFHSNHEA